MKNFAVIGLCLSLTGCAVVGPGQRGVRVSLGKVDSQPLNSGVYLWIPSLYGMTKLDIQVQKSEVETSSASKDMQEITTHVAVNWSLNPEKVVEIFSNIGDEDVVLSRVISPAVAEALKSEMAKYTAEEVLSKRMELKNNIDAVLKARLSGYGVSLQDLSIVNLKFGHEFTESIERKQVAEQRALQAKYEAQKAEQDAVAMVNRAKGTAEAQRLMRTTLTPELIQQQALEKWNGVLPTIVGGNGAIPFINVK